MLHLISLSGVTAYAAALGSKKGDFEWTGLPLGSQTSVQGRFNGLADLMQQHVSQCTNQANYPK